jgi:signal transduction histidine kinase
MQFAPQPRTKLYGDLTFAVLILAAFAQFIFNKRLYGEPWQVVVTFVLGAVYGGLGVFGSDISSERSRIAIHAYYIVQCLIVTAAILLSPARGFFFILAMPLISQSMFDLDWRGAAALTLWLYAISVASVGIPYGLPAAFEASVGFFPAFLFTLVFSIITREASLGKRKAEEASSELAEANAQLRTLAIQAAELATTRERNRLAREIHDGVGHYLTVIKVQLDAASALLPADPERAAHSVETAARLAAEALDDVRRSVGTLAADTQRPPLLETLHRLVSDCGSAPAFRIEGTPRPLGLAAEHALLRTAQEGLTNVSKHAGPVRATLTLDFRAPEQVRLAVSDTGTGVTSSAKPEGHGLRGLRERIALLGGSVHAGSQPGGGFRLEVELPA